MPPRLSAFAADPPHGREGVLRGCGEAVLGGVPVVHRHDHRARARAKVPAQRVIRIQVAEHPAAAVEVHHYRVQALGGVAGR